MKKLLSIFLTLCMLSSMFAVFSVNTSAGTPQFYESFQIGESYYTSEAKEYAQKNGYTLIDFDLNKDCISSEVIFLAYKTTTNPDNAITDILVRYGKGCHDEKWYNERNGCTYTVIGGYDDNEYRSYIDVNRASGGDYVYIYVTNDKKAGNPITDLDVNQHYFAPFRNYYAVGIDYKGTIDNRADLNKGAWKSSCNFITFNRATYYSSLQLGANPTSDASAIEEATRNGYSLLSYIDLNEDAGGNYIYLAYKATTDKSKAIRDIICVSGEEYGNMSSLKYNDCTYYPVGGYYNNAHSDLRYYTALDLNKNAGGDWLYLFYTTDEKAGDPILYLTVTYDESSYWDTVKFKGTDIIADLNKNAGGEFIYLLYNKSAYVYTGSLFNESSTATTIVIGVVIVIGIVAGVLYTKKRNFITAKA